MILKHLLVFSFFFLSSAKIHAEFKVPYLTSPVVDQAHMLPSNQEARLGEVLRKLKQQGGSQIQVLTLKNLDGLTIEQASIKVVDEWKLGTKDKDNGVLLLIAQQERKIRIEVGQGLEGDLPDAIAKRIISEVMIPLFQAGQPESGILLGTMNIVEKTDPQFPFKSYFEGQSFQSQQRVSKEKSLISRIFSILIFLALLILFIKNPVLFLLLLQGGGRGGYRGGGYGGGGGWSGGGGGFSGGGASGGW